ncbi:MAG: ATP-binding protein [Syntrophales bacterium]
MKQIVVISGKGGTGKTILTACFAVLADRKVLVDCDVDAADLHLLLHPVNREHHEFKSSQVAEIQPARCSRCGLCIDLCRFDAIESDFVVDPISCEGCGLCSRICPVDAVSMKDRVSGEWFVSDTRYGPFVHARLGIAEANSGKLVTLIRQTAKEIAVRDNLDYVIIDGPPGIGCPVMASLADTDLALVVTEPTVAGIHDLSRIIDVTHRFQTSAGVVINKFDLNLSKSGEIERLCGSSGVDIMGKIPFSAQVPRSLVKGVPFVELFRDPVAAEITSVWKKAAAAAGPQE